MRKHVSIAKFLLIKSRMADHVIDNLGDKLELKQNLERLLVEEGYIENRITEKKINIAL